LHGRNFLPHGPATGKATVFGMIERGTPGKSSKVRAMVVHDHKRRTLAPLIHSNVLPGSVLYTDALRSYRNLGPDYLHAFVDHMKTYVEGRVHTNTIENFWACLKRGLHGTYICARAFHLDRYLDEQVFRFNARDGQDADRFVAALKGTDGRRVTYKALKAENPDWRAKRDHAATRRPQA
jgi:transposase-like protein